MNKVLLRKSLAPLGLGALLLFGFGLTVAGSGPFAPVHVTVSEAKTGHVVPSLSGMGIVEAQRSYFIGPTTPGRVLAVHVDVGERVNQGQILAEMDPVDMDKRLSALTATLARAESGVITAKAQYQDSQARFHLATINGKRYAELGNRHFVSASAVESRQQEQVSAQAAQDMAVANLNAARQEVTRLQAEVQGLRLQRQSLRLESPHAGLVTARDAEAGSTVVAGQSVIRMIDPESLWIKVRLDQGYAGLLQGNMTAGITLRSDPEHKFKGRVVRIDPVGDSITEERMVFVVPDQVAIPMTIGDLSEVVIYAPETEKSIVIPGAAIRHTVTGTGVWLLRQGKPVFTAVKPGKHGLDGDVQIREGLREGDIVITHSEKPLTSDTHVRMVERLDGAGS